MRTQIGITAILGGAALLCLPLALGCHSAGSRDGQPVRRDGTQHGRVAWNRMRTMAPDQPYDQYEEKVLWWLDLSRLLAAEFWAMAFKDHSDESVAFLARQFGKYGAEADMRLLLSATDVFLAQDYPDPGANISVTAESPPEKRCGVKKLRELQLTVSKVQVEMFLRDPELFDRYYNFLIWSRQFLGTRHSHWAAFGPKIGDLEKGFDRSDETGDYWWHARNFMLVAHASSRDDLLKGADPSGLVGRFDEWHAWVVSNYEDLMPQLAKPVWLIQPGSGTSLEWGEMELRALREPATPFENWDGAVPFFTERTAFWYIGQDLPGWLYSAGKTYQNPLSQRPSP